ncbi:zinc finger protein [Xylariales sp. AK1849]|nr:zinc finger protein [Xylariales sp. AK1849]
MASTATGSGVPVNGTSDSSGSTRGDGQGRGRGRGRGRGGPSHPRRGRPQRGGRGRGGPGAGRPEAGLFTQEESTQPTVMPATKEEASGAAPPADGGDDDVEAEVCFICASPVVHQSVAPCNHRTCHICALRMRALYKNKECAHCRTAAPYVIFTDDGIKRFQDYSEKAPDITSTDENIGIRYSKEDIVGDTVLLLRYNCPEADCDFAGLGWPDLHRHVRSIHQKKMCDLCTRNKKVFTHEHELFTDKELERHMRHGDDRPGAVDQTGFRGHPLCAFCGSRFYDDDKLYEHCRLKHERCFLCDRQDPRQPHYYINYNALEQHFRKDHHPCSDPECQEKKFVVFASEMDLKAHQLSEHGSTLSKDVRRDARLVDMAGFDFRQPYQQERRGGGSGRQRDRDGEGRGSGRGRDPNAEPIPASSAQPMRRDEVAFQRQMAIHSSQSISNRTFGGQLSSGSPAPTAAATQPTPRNVTNTTSLTAPAAPTIPASEMDGIAATDLNLTPEERARLVRHAAVIERASNLLHNDNTKISTFRSQISSFRQGKISAATLIDSFFSLFSETSTTALGTLIREVADLFEDISKAEQVRKSWNDWRAINEDYPTLPGLSGMHGATTSNSGWASAAASSPVATAAAPTQRHTTRVLKLKSSTQQSQRSTAQQSVTWTAAGDFTRPPPPAAAFPSLPSGSKPPPRSSTPATSTPLWRPGGPTQPSNKSSPKTSGRDDNFPALPSAPKPTTTIFGYGRGAVRRDFGGPRATGFSWGGADAGDDAGPATTEHLVQDADSTEDRKGKRKGNKGRKNILVQWG